MKKINNNLIREHIHRHVKKHNWICSECGRLYPDTMIFCPRCNIKRDAGDYH